MSDDYDPEDHGYSLDDVCDRLDHIEEAVKANHWDFRWVGWAALIWLALLVWIPDMWYSKTRYAWWYGVRTDQVTIEKKPTDCNFFRSPMGDKGCHYDRRINIVKADPNQWGGQSISNDSGNTWMQTAKNEYGIPLVSHDNGKTWSTDSVPAHTEPQVIIGWDRVDEDKD